MAGRREHDLAGVVVGAANALLTSRKNASPYEIVAEAIGGAIGGRLGSRVPDFLEPAVHSHHRDVMHSVGVAGVLAVKGREGAAQLVERLRERADDCARRRAASPDIFERVLLLLAETACRMAAGFVGGVVPGYLSHLALDAMTPRRIPLIAARLI